MSKALSVFRGNDGVKTRAYYAELEKCGPLGIVALNLFRAQKCSTTAKRYRGGIKGLGSYRSMAYERKRFSMENLCRVLGEHGPALGMGFGWKRDPNHQGFNSWVLYIDLPGFGQVSFHAPSRGDGPDYPGDWDGHRASEARILAFCDAVHRNGGASCNLTFGELVAHGPDKARLELHGSAHGEGAD